MYWFPVWKQIGWKHVGKSLSRVTVRAAASVGAELAGGADAGATAEAEGAVDVAGVWPPHAETKITAIASAAARIRMVLLLQGSGRGGDHSRVACRDERVLSEIPNFKYGNRCVS
jgi:hypothetical protein